MGNIRVHKRYRRVYKRALRMKAMFTHAEIARKLGIPWDTVNRWLSRPRGSDRVKVRDKYLSRYHEALRLYREEHLSWFAIARTLRLYPWTVRYWLRKEAQ